MARDDVVLTEDGGDGLSVVSGAEQPRAVGVAATADAEEDDEADASAGRVYVSWEVFEAVEPVGDTVVVVRGVELTAASPVSRCRWCCSLVPWLEQLPLGLKEV